MNTKKIPPSLVYFKLAENTSSRKIRLLCRSEKLFGPTATLAPGFLQSNLVIVPKRYSFDFLLFCLRNPRACPLLDVIDAGFETKLAHCADLRTDLPKYRIWKNGQVHDEPKNILPYWREDFVSFLLGCSFSFEKDLRDQSLFNNESTSVPMYKTKIKNIASGVFRGNLVVSMRQFFENDIEKVYHITERHQLSHGKPIGMGRKAQEELGILDLNQPDYGETVAIKTDMIPLFWACGVTPQSAIEEAKEEINDIIITHYPGCMFITDVPDDTAHD